MKKDERVVVLAHLERKHNADKTVFAARIRALGLTAYGASPDDAMLKLRRMFATYADLYRKCGTLEERLNKCGLDWWYESDYQGPAPALMIGADGEARVIAPRTPYSVDLGWQADSSVVVAQ